MNPYQIGVITIGGGAVALSTLAVSTPHRHVKTLYIDNSLGVGNVFLGAATMNISTLAGVVIVIPAGQAKSIGGFKDHNEIDWTVYYVHGSNAGDLVNITGQTVS